MKVVLFKFPRKISPIMQKTKFLEICWRQKPNKNLNGVERKHPGKTIICWRHLLVSLSLLFSILPLCTCWTRNRKQNLPALRVKKENAGEKGNSEVIETQKASIKSTEQVLVVRSNYGRWVDEKNWNISMKNNWSESRTGRSAIWPELHYVCKYVREQSVMTQIDATVIVASSNDRKLMKILFQLQLHRRMHNSWNEWMICWHMVLFHVAYGELSNQ